MSEADKTEKPTPKRLRDARKKGQVAKSKEIPSAVIVCLLMFFIWANSDYLLEKLTLIFQVALLYEVSSFDVAFRAVVHEIFSVSILIITIIVGLSFLAGVFANFFQIGFLFAPESIKPDLKKLNPVEGFKKIFSVKNLVELLKSMFKILFLSGLIYMVLLNSIPLLFHIPECGVKCILPILGKVMYHVIIYTAIAFILIAVLDYVFQKMQHIKQLMMSKDEIKKEYKEMEGNPEIKGKRKQFFQEIVNSQTRQNVKRSSVIVTNPTHYAVGLLYDDDKTPLPVITLKEEGTMAKHIIQIAEEEGVPIMRNVPLAHSLMEQSMVDQYIPEDLIKPVAEVLAVIQDLSP